MASTGNRSVVVLASTLAWLLAGIMISSARAEGLSPIEVAEDYAAGEELETFASCTWPLDPLTLASRFSSPKLGLLLEDTPTMFAVVMFVVLAWLAMYVDSWELALMSEDDDDAKKEEEQESSSPPSSTSLAVVFLALAAAWQFTLGDPVQALCQRLPLLAAKRDYFFLAWNALAKEELWLLPDGLSVRPALADDFTLMVLLGVFVFFGAIWMYSDVQEMEEEAEEEDQTQDGQAAGVGEMNGKETSWSQYVTAHARQVSCVVLLLSMFGAMTGAIYEGTM